MKFRKEDIGLYFSFSLVGGGVGLLLGAFVASRLAARRDAEEELKSDAEQIERFRTLPPPNDEMGEEDLEYDPYSEELLDFIDELHPSAIQIEMIHKGLVTMDDVRNMLRETETLVESYDYGKEYRIQIDDDKPDLKELVALPEDLEPIDGRFILSSTLPKGRTQKKVREIYYDHADDTFSQARGGRFVPLHSLDGVINAAAWEQVLKYLLSGIETIFVLDSGTAKLQSFTLVPQEEESDDVGTESA